MTNLIGHLHMLASTRNAALASTAAAIITLSGCASWPPGGLPPGTPIDTARHGFSSPTAEFALPNGGTRLEFAQGSFGKQTYMLDFDPSGQLIAKTQVLTEDNFATITPGLPEHDLLMTLYVMRPWPEWDGGFAELAAAGRVAEVAAGGGTAGWVCPAGLQRSFRLPGRRRLGR